MKNRDLVSYRAAATAAALLGALLSSPVLAGDDAKQCSGPTCTGTCAAHIDAAERERLSELVTHQRDELVNLARTLVVDHRRQSELETELANARSAKPAQPVAPQAPANAAALEQENSRLRSQLDAEREENHMLASKLRTASKVTDLVFRSSGVEQASATEKAPRGGPDQSGSAWKAAEMQ